MTYSTSSRSRLLLAWLLSLGAGLLPGFGQTITSAPGQIESFIEHATQNTSTTALTYFTVTDASRHSLPNGLPIDFGSIDIGGFKTQSYTVTNSHIIGLTSLTATIDGADAADFVLSSTALGVLAVSASTTFSITYVPELASKASAAALHLRSVNGSCVYDFPLTATGGNLNPTVRVEEVGGAVVTSLSAPLDFGSPMLGQSTSKTFLITNTGTAPLRDVSVARDDAWHWGWNGWYYDAMGNYGLTLNCYSCYYDPTYQYESGFTVAGDITSVILPGESRTITVTWKPYETAQKTRNITLSWAMRSSPAPPPTYDLTGGSLGFTLNLSATATIANPFAPYTPPVRFSIPVTGAAVPYASDPPLLGGLQYHLGNENSTGRLIASTPGQPPPDPMLGAVSSCGPDSAGFVPSTLERWKPSALPFNPNTYGNVSNINWRSYSQIQLIVIAQTLSDPVFLPTPGVIVVTSPTSVYVTGPGSAADALGSQVAVAFNRNNRLINPNIQLPASDNVGMELWLKPSRLSGTQCVAFIGAAADAGFGLWLVDGVLQGRAGSSSIEATTPALAVDAWHHVAFLVQGGSASLYVDGVLVGSSPSVTLPDTVRGLSIGAMLDGSSGYEGQVDELRLFEIPASGFDVANHLLANATPSAALDRSVIDFGNVVPAATTQRSATLSNTGPGWLRVLAMEVTGDGASDYSISALGPYNSSTPLLPDATLAPVYPTGGYLGTLFGILGINNSLPAYAGVGTSIAYRTSVAPQTKLEATITHTASTLGPRPATLRITTNDPAHPVYEIALNASTVAAPAPQPKLWLSNSDAWDWGTLLTNETAQRGFYLGNLGAVSISSFTVEVIGPNASDISFSARGGAAITSGPETIPNGDFSTVDITLTAQPRAAGARYAALRITSDDPERPEIIIPIYGRAVQAVPEIAVTVTGNVAGHAVDGNGHPLAPNDVLVNSSATLLADGGSVEFVPALAGGNSSSLPVILHNIGTDILEVASITIDGADAAAFSIMAGDAPVAVPQPFSVQPNNGVAWLPVRFTPSRVGTHSATLHITSNDADESPYDIALTGEGLTPAPFMQVIERGTVIASGDGFLRFGTAVIGGTAATQAIHVRNIGTAPLTDFGAEFSGPNPGGGNIGEFTINIPRPIAGGAEGDILVSFAPQDIGPRSTVLTLTSNDPSNSRYRITLGGTGAYGSRSNLAPVAIPGWVGTALAELPDGSIVMAGYVPTFDSEGNEQTPTSKLRVIGKDGSERTSAQLRSLSLWGTIRSMALASDNCLMITGELRGYSYPGAHQHGPGEVCSCNPFTVDGFLSGIAALMPTTLGLPNPSNRQGYMFTNFTPPTGDFTGRAVLALPDGKVLVGGTGSLDGRANIIRLNADGTLDSTFTLPEPNGPVNALAMQDDDKVLIGGEFTNLDTTATQTSVNSPEVRDGLCRLKADGSLDDTFINPGISSVTALSKKGHFLGIGGTASYSYGGQPVAMLVSHAHSVADAGMLLGTDYSPTSFLTLTVPPRCIGIQPSGRLWCPDVVASEAYTRIRSVLKHYQDIEWPGELIEGDAALLASLRLQPYSANVTMRRQAFDGEVNAILAQADGKVVVAGSLTSASVVRANTQINYPAESLPQPSAISPVVDDSPLPPETPLAGFVQLDVDGFFNASPIVISPSVAAEYAGASHYQNELRYMTTDGLAKIEVTNADQPAESGLLTSTSGFLTLTPGLFAVELPQLQHGPVTVTIDGPDAAAFVHAEDPFPVMRSAVMWGPQTMYRQFVPSRAGKHHAVLHVHQDGIANDFDIALEGTGVGSLPDQVRLVDTAGHVFQGSETRDLGSVTFGSSATLDLRLFNDDHGPNSTPFELSVTGANASDFSVSPSTIDSIPGSTNDGAGFVPITVTFSPSNTGSRAAILSLVTVTHGPQGDTRSIPFTVNLTGTGTVGAPAITSVPQDVLVMEGEPFSLSAGFEFSQSVLVEWHQQRGSRDSVVRTSGWDVSGSNALTTNSDTLAITSATTTSAGLYRVVASNSAGSSSSRPAQVGVVSVLNRDIAVAQGQTANFGVSFIGPPTMPGTSAARYQWRLNGQPIANSARFSSAMGGSLAVANVTDEVVGIYTCEVSLGTATLVTPAIQLRIVGLPTVTAVTHTPWRVAQPVDSIIEATHTPTRYTATGLPFGVLLNASTGQLSGRPRSAGNYTLRITASNVAGTSAVFTQEITVEALPPGMVGSFAGNLARDVAYNDALGGTWTLVVSPSGAFTGKLRLGSNSSATAKTKAAAKLSLGRLIDYPIAGTLELTRVTPSLPIPAAGSRPQLQLPPPPYWLATASLLVQQSPTGKAFTIMLELYPEGQVAAVYVQREGGARAGLGATLQSVRSVPSKIVGNYRANLIANPALPADGALTGIMSVIVNRSGGVVWVARLGREIGATIATGTGNLIQSDDDPCFATDGFVFYPNAAGARSLKLSLSIYNDGPKPTLYGEAEWGNRTTYGSEGAGGDLYRQGQFSEGMKLR